MSNILYCVIIIYCVKTTVGLFCYNCSSTHRDWNRCGGEFGTPRVAFNSSRHYLVNCTEVNAMCFVRSWTARAKHAWLVQRGCYQSNKDDPLPMSMNIPTRAMSCKRERLADGEYVACLCKANWCNAANVNILSYIAYLIMSCIGIVTYFYKLNWFS